MSVGQVFSALVCWLVTEVASIHTDSFDLERICPFKL